jgi:hypothetical protein
VQMKRSGGIRRADYGCEVLARSDRLPLRGDRYA